MEEIATVIACALTSEGVKDPRDRKRDWHATCKISLWFCFSFRLFPMLNHFNISFLVQDAYLGVKKGFTTAEKRGNGGAIHGSAY